MWPIYITAYNLRHYRVCMRMCLDLQTKPLFRMLLLRDTDADAMMSEQNM